MVWAEMSDPESAPDPLAPRRNPTLIGHAAAENLLAETQRAGRLPHAILIGGPRGIGKATLAFRFARWLLAGGGNAEASLFGQPVAQDGLQLDPDHPVYRRAASAGHADLMTVERGWDKTRKRLRGDIVVEDVREISHFLHLTSAEGGWRVVVIDGADEMNRSAANALLKVLEEPPRGTVLLLVCHAPGRLLPTIRSRCRRLILEPLAEDEVRALIQIHEPALPAGDAAILARLSGGSIGRALDLSRAGGIDLYRRMLALLTQVPRPETASLYQLADTLARADAAEAYHTFTDLLVDWLERTIGMIATGDPSEEILPGEAELRRRIAETGRLDRWVDVWDNLRAAFARTDDLTLDRKQAILEAFFALAAPFG
jgi:DNA polymerase-3 subunit delta'